MWILLRLLCVYVDPVCTKLPFAQRNDGVLKLKIHYLKGGWREDTLNVTHNGTYHWDVVWSQLRLCAAGKEMSRNE